MLSVTQLRHARRTLRVVALASISVGLLGCSGDSTRLQSQIADAYAQEPGSVPPAPIGRDTPRVRVPQPQPRYSQPDPPPSAYPQSSYPQDSYPQSSYPQSSYPESRNPQGGYDQYGRADGAYGSSRVSVTAQPLPPVVAAPQSYPTPQSYPASQSYPAQQSYPTPQSYPVSSVGVSGGGRGVSSYAPPAPPAVAVAAPAPKPVNVAAAAPARPRLDVTGTVAPRSVAAARPAPGSTMIIVGTSDTLEVLARRYHVTPAAILAANGYKGPRTLSPGQQLIIPHLATTAAPAAVVPASRPVVSAASPGVHFVNSGDSMAAIARKYRVSAAELARANGMQPSATLRPGTRLTIPRSPAVAQNPGPAAAPRVTARNAAPAPRPVAVRPIEAAVSRHAAPAPQSVHMVQPAPAVEDKPVANGPKLTADKSGDTTGALPNFRWPARGNVKVAYGVKTNGKANDGINIEVPTNTPIKAADDGEVTYSGNELKAYGNLVLIRHANGYITAYAHANELLVRRGDHVKRGQIIAKSGSSGEVERPQLHFEIRKGSTPVDPAQFLNGT